MTNLRSRLEPAIRLVRPNLLWVVAALLLVIVHAVAASGANLPIYWEDEAGYLANGQVLAGVGEVPDLRGRPYYLGWSLLLVPFWWIFQDAQLVYQAAVVIAALCGIAMAVPLALIANRLGLGWRWSVVAGSVIAAAPARTVYSGFGLPENLLAILIAFAVLFAIRYWDRQSVGNALGLALFVGGAFATHGRVIPLVAATGLWFVWTLRRRPIPSVVGLLALGAVVIGSFLLYREVTTLLYGADGDREGTGISRILSAQPLSTLMSAIGQLWYIVIAWLGLAVIGVTVLGPQLKREWRERSFGPAVWGLIAALGIAVISFTSISSAIERGSSRLDILSYGRYLDPIVVPVALIGLVIVIKGASRRVMLATLITTAATCVAWYAIVWPNRSYEGTSWWALINVTGLLQYGFQASGRLPWAPWLLATIVALVAVTFAFFFRKKIVLVVAVLMVFFVASSVYIEFRVVRPQVQIWNKSFTLREVLRDDPVLAGEPVSFDISGLTEAGDVASKNAYQLLLAPTSVELFDSETTDPQTELVIARQDWPQADELGAIKVSDDDGLFSNALWVLPGPIQDELVADGVIVP